MKSESKYSSLKSTVGDLETLLDKQAKVTAPSGLQKSVNSWILDPPQLELTSPFPIRNTNLLPNHVLGRKFSKY